MEYRKFRNTGIDISLLGMGCMRLPRLDDKSEAIDYKRAEEIIDYAYNNGINYFDTAYVYNQGDSEAVTGKALSKYPRESYYLATKLPGWSCSSEKDVYDRFQEQLDRCGTDYFDFYLLHNINENSINDYTVDYILPPLLKLKQEGKIRYLGFSSHAEPQMLEGFADRRNWDFAQIQLNYLDWTYLDAKRQYEILNERGIPVIIMEPVRGGRLASLCGEADMLLKAAAPEKSVASWALRYAASLDGVLTVLSGMSTLDQIVDNVNTFNGFTPVTEFERNLLDKAAEILKNEFTAPCTGCRYCIECPMHLDIPDLISAYNDFSISNSKMDLIRLTHIPDEKKPGECINCGQCEAHCPQGINIPQIMARLANELIDMPIPPGM